MTMLVEDSTKRAVAVVTATDRMGHVLEQIHIARELQFDVNRDINDAYPVLLGRYPDAYIFIDRLGNKRVEETRSIMPPLFRSGMIKRPLKTYEA
jgi:hypothetical protein